MSRADPRPMKNVTKPTIMVAGTRLTILANNIRTYSYIPRELTCVNVRTSKINAHTYCSLHQGHHRAETS